MFHRGNRFGWVELGTEDTHCRVRTAHCRSDTHSVWNSEREELFNYSDESYIYIYFHCLFGRSHTFKPHERLQADETQPSQHRAQKSDSRNRLHAPTAVKVTTTEFPVLGWFGNTLDQNMRTRSRRAPREYSSSTQSQSAIWSRTGRAASCMSYPSRLTSYAQASCKRCSWDRTV